MRRVKGNPPPPPTPLPVVVVSLSLIKIKFARVNFKRRYTRARRYLHAEATFLMAAEAVKLRACKCMYVCVLCVCCAHPKTTPPPPPLYLRIICTCIYILYAKHPHTRSTNYIALLLVCMYSYTSRAARDYRVIIKTLA